MSLGAASAAGLWVRPGRVRAHAADDATAFADPPPDTVPEDARAFFLGVASGDVSPDRVSLWARYDGDDSLRVVVWQQLRGEWRQVLGQDLPRGVRGPVHVPVSALLAAQEFRYAFYVVKEGRVVARSRVGRFRTAPPPDALVPITLGAVCCTMNGRDQSVLEAAGTRRDLDALVVLGDNVYADGSTSLADFRKRWWENLEKPGWQALRASTSVTSTWDDHEVHNDWDPETVEPERLAAARTAFYEHVPMCRAEECPERLWRKLRFGRTAEVFVLDSRGERKRSANPPEYLSRTQMDWLKQSLKVSDAMFKIVVNTVPISRFPPMFATTKYDRWEGFPEQRDEILSFTESGSVPGVLWLSGDFHLAMIARASATGLGSKSLEVLAGPGAQVGHPFAPWLFGRQFDWSSAENNVTTLKLDPARKHVTITHWGKQSEKIHEAVYRQKRIGYEKVEDWLL